MDPDIPVVTGFYSAEVPTAPIAQEPPPTQLTDTARKILKEQGYTEGLLEAIEMNKVAFFSSIWVVDNSGSMQTTDGQRIVEQPRGGGFKFVRSSRWQEMQQTVDYHCQMASLLQTPTTFRMLNDPGRVAGPQVFSIGTINPDEDLAIAQRTMDNAQPAGVTPLTRHLHEIRSIISSMSLSAGQRVSVILATDGTATDERGYENATVKENFKEALGALKGLPVWIVVRLCTDEENVVEYWNEIDSQLEFDIEVLDDFQAEAQEVNEHNPWLNYALPLHRMREMGFYHKVFDSIDERALSRDEVKEMARILFGRNKMRECPDPEFDWKAFSQVLAQYVAAEGKQWNPITKKVMPWIDMKKVNKIYGPPSFFGGLFG